MSPVNLAISLHSVDDKVRSRLMPVNDRYSLDELLEACREFPLPKRKRIMFEYTLLKGINDSDKDAIELSRKLRGIPCKINLLPYNESSQLPFKALTRIASWLFRKYYSMRITQSLSEPVAALISLPLVVNWQRENDDLKFTLLPLHINYPPKHLREVLNACFI